MDRNFVSCIDRAVYMSLSARRAWIEIALLNPQNRYLAKSLSARRAWIEIQELLKKY